MLLEVHGLKTNFRTDYGVVRAVDGVDLWIDRGQIVGLVGESGCGKSVTARSILRLIRRPGEIVGGEILFEGENLMRKSEEEMRRIRGARISMIFQDPMNAMNPRLKIGEQIMETVVYRDSVATSLLGRALQKLWPSERRRRRQAREQSLEMLQRVGIPAATERFEEYPHQFSGGMIQRVMIAIALVNRPQLLIADEPTTALDVTIQAQILDLLRELRSDLGMSILLITHDLGIVAEMCDFVYVMYAGEIVEQGTLTQIFDHPAHPYTRGLLECIPRIDDLSQGKLSPIPGNVPSLIDLPQGCHFKSRCPLAEPLCDSDPAFIEVAESQKSRCHFAQQLRG